MLYMRSLKLKDFSLLLTYRYSIFMLSKTGLGFFLLPSIGD
jgi:hypothetical protein